ncbi:MAG: DNA repair protein RecO C-terminal domain-containing protein, partial [Bacteroidales bacterium]|nr:DNA repair protein RecO C-terminal domain-containing protein [Bacteroidales bacterium]
EEYGRMSYLATRPRSKKSNLKSAFFQPLSLVEIEADHQGSRHLQRIKEIRSLYNFSGIPYDPVKNAISLFLAEVLYRSLRETEKNTALFDYISGSIQLLDLCDKGLANFHLVFLIKLTRFMGFYPNVEEQQPHWYFDLQGGSFTPTRPLHNAWLKPEEAADFALLMRMNFDNIQAFQFERHQRVEILRQMLNYYRMHLTDFPSIRSLNVLQELFD